MPSFTMRRRIEFIDTDMSGIVHFSRFFVFMETAEHELLRSLGTSVALEIDGDEIGWPRVAASCEYESPVRFGDVLDIEVSVARRGSKSMTYDFVMRVGDRVAARGRMTSVCCIMGGEAGARSIPIPEPVAAKIDAHLAGED